MHTSPRAKRAAKGTTRKENHEQTSGGQPTAVEEHPTGDPSVNTEGLSDSKANVAVASNSEHERTAILPRSLAQELVLVIGGRIERGLETARGEWDQARTCRAWTDGHYGPRRSRQMAAIRGGPLGSLFGLFAAAARRGGFLCME
eukprot:COSAG05_NODE_6647_length_925_cov_1.488513_1_plen_144_part_10